MARRSARLVPGLLVLTMLALAACDGPARTTGRSCDDSRDPGSHDDGHDAGFDRDDGRGGVVHGGEDGPEAGNPRTAVGQLGALCAAVVIRATTGWCSSSRAPRCRATASSTSARSLGETDDQFPTLQGGALVQAIFQGSASEDHRPGTQTVPDKLTLVLARVSRSGWPRTGRVWSGSPARPSSLFRVLELHDLERVVVDFAT